MRQARPGRPALDGLISRRQLRDWLDVSDMTIWRWERAGTFPQHISINGRNYWRRREVTAWLDRQGEPTRSTAEFIE